MFISYFESFNSNVNFCAEVLKMTEFWKLNFRTLVFHVAQLSNFDKVVGHVFNTLVCGVRLHEMIVYANIVLTCIGACMAYIIFICETLPLVITALTTVGFRVKLFSLFVLE